MPKEKSKDRNEERRKSVEPREKRKISDKKEYVQRRIERYFNEAGKQRQSYLSAEPLHTKRKRRPK